MARSNPQKRRSKRASASAKTPAERKLDKENAEHMRATRAVFRNCGFQRVPEVSGRNIKFKDRPGELDDAFLLENLFVIVEYTNSNASGVSSHLKDKKIIFDRIIQNHKEFLGYLKEKFPRFGPRVGTVYHEDRMQVRIAYCSRQNYDEDIRKIVENISYLDYPVVKYFEKISSIIKLTARNEFLEFIDVDPLTVGDGGRFPKKDADEKYSGLLLPEEASGFPAGYKVVSFYADASSLLQRAFVLRRSGWRGSQEAYQRMLLPAKIESIRKKLKEKGQVAINNIIATLPSDVLPVGADNKTINIKDLTETAPVRISLPLRPNTIGLIDGQHRLFAYYRSKEDDPKIALLREQQNLLVTAIIYPENQKPQESERFEATLFLGINSNQASAPAELRQEIEVLLNPFGLTAISKQVMERLASTGPLAGHVERYFYDKGLLKTSSIVNFGLGPLLKLAGEDSLFSTFRHPERSGILDGSSPEALAAYISHASTHINIVLSAFNAAVGQDRWTTDKIIKNKILTVTFVNSILIVIRSLILNKKEITFDSLSVKLKKIGGFEFSSFHSSQYNRMAAQIYAQYLS